MAMKKVSQGKRASKPRANSGYLHAHVQRAQSNQPVSEGIRRAAARMGIEPPDDGARVTVMRGDLARAALEIQAAFDDVFEAELSDDAGQHDVLVLRALRRLRAAKSMVECEIGGAL